jgi:hypothetical protein
LWLASSEVDDHFMVIPEEEKPTPYSDEVFKEVPIHWLIETDQVLFCSLFKNHSYFSFLCQPIQVFEHPTFKHLISVASCVMKGVKIPNQKQTHDEIISSFKKQMKVLKDCFNVSLSLPLLTQILTVTLECSCKA